MNHTESEQNNMNAAPSQVAYLGPDGTFAHLVAKQRFASALFVPQRSIADVFRFVEQAFNAEGNVYGVVPIENSSAGNIYGTIDELVAPDFQLKIADQVDLNVKLYLMGKSPKVLEVAKRLYSHFAALNHCGEWLSQHYPHLEQIPVSSTAEAARLASQSSEALALASRSSAEAYQLAVLDTPAQKTNVTQFIVLAKPNSPPISPPIGKPENPRKVTLVADLPSTAGSLVNFLLPFKENNVNLSRILSRPIKGEPNRYVFLIDVEGALTEAGVKAAIERGQDPQISRSVRVIGDYSKFGTLES